MNSRTGLRIKNQPCCGVMVNVSMNSHDFMAAAADNLQLELENPCFRKSLPSWPDARFLLTDPGPT